MKARILFAPVAREQARDATRWWRANRTAAPHLFVAEIRGALALLAEAPGLGRLYPHPVVKGVRRLLLAAVRHHVYYVHDEAAGTVEIVAVWSAVRKKGPELRVR